MQMPGQVDAYRYTVRENHAQTQTRVNTATLGLGDTYSRMGRHIHVHCERDLCVCTGLAKCIYEHWVGRHMHRHLDRAKLHGY